MTSIDIDRTRERSAAISYLDEGAELPVDRLELYWLLKRAMKHVFLISATTITSREGLRDGAHILARCLRRAAVVAQAIADSEPVSPVQEANAQADTREISRGGGA